MKIIPKNRLGKWKISPLQTFWTFFFLNPKYSGILICGNQIIINLIFHAESPHIERLDVTSVLTILTKHQYDTYQVAWVKIKAVCRTSLVGIHSVPNNYTILA